MFSPPTHRFISSLVLVASCTLFSTACSTGAQLRGQAEEIQHINESIEDRAYRCAPRELAAAQAHVEFGLYEVSKGDFVQANRHLRVAEQNARLARAMSDFDECELQDRVADTGIAEIEEVQVDTVDFM